MPKSAITKLLNTKLFRDDQKSFKFMQIHENEEDQSIVIKGRTDKPKIKKYGDFLAAVTI